MPRQDHKRLCVGQGVYNCVGLTLISFDMLLGDFGHNVWSRTIMVLSGP